jgi:hypothetical protein
MPYLVSTLSGKFNQKSVEFEQTLVKFIRFLVEFPRLANMTRLFFRGRLKILYQGLKFYEIFCNSVFFLCSYLIYLTKTLKIHVLLIHYFNVCLSSHKYISKNKFTSFIINCWFHILFYDVLQLKRISI